MTQLMLVGLGGFLGTIFRFTLYQLSPQRGFPHTTLTVNLLGSLLMGILLASPLSKIESSLYPFLAVGLLGGFTTYSAFSGEAVSLLQKGNLVSTFTYLCVTVLGGLISCFLGVVISRWIWK